jgi:hypothetical protein
MANASSSGLWLLRSSRFWRWVNFAGSSQYAPGAFNTGRLGAATLFPISSMRFSATSHDEHDVVGILDHYSFEHLARPKEIPNAAQTSTRLVKERRTQPR